MNLDLYLMHLKRYILHFSIAYRTGTTGANDVVTVDQSSLVTFGRSCTVGRRCLSIQPEM